MKNTIILGDEYDEKLKSNLVEVIRDMGGIIRNMDWVVAGSQEIQNVKVDISEKVIEIESETYIGLSINGDADLVSEIAKKVSQSNLK